jgi:acetyl esterase/lipase
LLFSPKSSGTNPSLPVLIYIHGGGWVQGSVQGYRGVCAHYAAASGCAVLSVDYRLAPEHPAPAAVEDSYAAVQWVCNGVGEGTAVASALGLAGIVAVGVGGDSAGGNLAAVTSIMAARDGLQLLFQLLLFPVSVPLSPAACTDLLFPVSVPLSPLSLSPFFSFSFSLSLARARALSLSCCDLCSTHTDL